jgi:transposase-like protein
MRNALSTVPKSSQDMVASIIRTIFAQPDTEHASGQVAKSRLNRIEGRFQRLETDPLPCTKSVLQSHSAAAATANNFCPMNV